MFKIFKKKEKKDEMPKYYDVYVTNHLEKEDTEYLKPIITIVYYSKFNPSVELTAQFSKNESLDGLSLLEAYTELSNIINECRSDNIVFKVSFNNGLILNNEEIQMVQNINNLVSFGKWFNTTLTDISYFRGVRHITKCMEHEVVDDK